ncbi:MAG: bifunctional folylpolyglutamate synthase/dihydrofolate synthase [Candidatus Omnitrophica bacterium]|nr:bifunctional folylpolyglutamate synthase/dihydrofolate synthase [Candidatus Omnitrophota bacterium]
MTYPQAIKYLETFINYEKLTDYPYKESLKLERIKDFLRAIGDPQESLKCIHIAGTKGKGSTSAFITYILRSAGFKVGLYTSPHLSDFRERIRVLREPGAGSREPGDFEGMVSQKDLTRLVKKIKPAIEKYNQKSKYGPLSFFEVYTALAFVYFLEQKTDFAVLETGLGGRLDATNVVNPLVCAITPISYEHTQKLGNSLREIATEKAGIIKDCQAIVISAPQEKEAQEVIETKCRKSGVKLYTIGKEIKYLRRGDSFTVKGLLRGYAGLKTSLIGEHQLINASVAVGVIEALASQGAGVDASAIKRGIAQTLWPGRCEIISKNPLIILDGAQNIASAAALKEAIKKNFRYRNLILVLGISSDKDLRGICRELADLADKVILTKANNPRAASPERLAGNFAQKENYLTYSLKEAKELALSLAGKQDLILVTGSLFVVGEFRDV